MGKHSAKSGLYLYAVAPSPGEGTLGFPGIDGKPVCAISSGRLAAIVSEAPNGKIRPERRYLAAHQDVLKRLMQTSTVLPVSFGIIADGPGAIETVLARNRKGFLEQLNRVTGKVEMGLRVTWDVPNIFEYIVNTHPALRVARDRLLSNPRGPSQDDKIELGEMFNRMLNEDREACTEKVTGILARCCFEIQPNPCRSEREVMNLACLVGREKQDKFQAAVFEAAKLFDNSFAFDYNGPWAPHNFVEMDLSL